MNMKVKITIKRDKKSALKPWAWSVRGGGRVRKGRRATEQEARLAADAAAVELQAMDSRPAGNVKPRTQVAFDTELVERWRDCVREFCDGMPLVTWLTELAEREREGLEKGR
jgi:hypothetical protein